MTCALCRSAPAMDPWTTCADCVATLPAVFRPPTLSAVGVSVCVRLRGRLLSGEYFARREEELDLCPPEPVYEPADPRLVGVQIPGIGVVAVAECSGKRRYRRAA